MSKAAVLGMALAMLLQEQLPGRQGFVIERKVHLKTWDLVRREAEIRRVERLKIAPGAVAIEDVTFGTTLVIRTDRKVVVRIDPLAKTWSEVSFGAVAARREAAMKELREARERVPGTRDAEEIDKTLQQLGEIPEGTGVELREAKGETLLGRACLGREVVVGKDRRILVQVDPGLSGALAFFDALAQIGAFPPAVAARLKELGGFPLKGEMRYSLFLKMATATEEVVSAAAAELPASDFEAPAGFTRVPFEGVDAVEAKPPEKPKNFEKSYREDEIDRGKEPSK